MQHGTISRFVATLAALGALGCASPLAAHHSTAEYDASCLRRSARRSRQRVVAQPARALSGQHEIARRQRAALGDRERRLDAPRSRRAAAQPAQRRRRRHVRRQSVDTNRAAHVRHEPVDRRRPRNPAARQRAGALVGRSRREYGRDSDVGNRGDTANGQPFLRARLRPVARRHGAGVDARSADDTRGARG